MLDVKKRAGMNMIDATTSVREIVDEAIENYFPQDLKFPYQMISPQLRLRRLTI